MPTEGDARPFSKASQLRRPEKRKKRLVAGRVRWEQIATAKQGPCRATGKPPPNQLAHLISRAQLGPDSEWNIVPLCPEAHLKFDQRDPETCRLVMLSLTDQEYAGLVEFGGESVFERRFGIRYERT